MRNLQSKDGHEHGETAGGGDPKGSKADKKNTPIPGGALGMLAKLPPLVPQAPIMTPAVTADEASRGPKVQKYRVTEDGRLCMHGQTTMLRRGKEIDARNYDIEEVRKQGIKLEEVKD